MHPVSVCVCIQRTGETKKAKEKEMALLNCVITKKIIYSSQFKGIKQKITRCILAQPEDPVPIANEKEIVPIA